MCVCERERERGVCCGVVRERERRGGEREERSVWWGVCVRDERERERRALCVCVM